MYLEEADKASGFPSARRLTSAAALRYDSNRVVERPWAADRLLKFPRNVSSGSQRLASISKSRSCCTLFPYSALVNLWNLLTPGFGFASAFWSTVVSNSSTRARSVSGFGLGIPGGGIMPALNFRIIFSAVSGWFGAFSTSNPVKERFPVINASL